MLFTVTYRDKNGAKAEMEIEAANRAKCFAQCKAHSIAPLGVREGRTKRAGGQDGGRAGERPASKRKLFTIRFYLFVAIAALAAISWWWLGREVAQPAPAEKPATPKAAKPQPAPKPAAKPVATNAAPVAKKEPLAPWNDSFMTNREMRLKYSTLFQATTNEGGLVIERYRLPNGKTWRKIVEPPPVFSNISDQAIAMVMAGAAGAPIPPVPGLGDANLDAEFLKSLEVPIRVESGDSPRIAALKLAVKETRDEIVRLKAEGDKRTVGQMLSEHIKANNRNAEMQAEALRAIEEVRRKDGDEMAEEYLKAVNENLKSYGVAPVSTGRRRAPTTEK